MNRPSDRERRLEALNETARELMAAGTREEVAETGVEAASEVIGLEANAIHLQEEDALVPAAVTEATRDLVGDPPTFHEGEAIAWRVYETGEPTVIEDVREDPDVYNPETPIRSELFLPLGEHGVLLAGSPAPSAFDESELSLARVLSANVEAALEQVRRERELARKNERLEEFARVVSHDLRSPLSVAEGYLDLAREEGKPEQFDRIERAHDRMERIIDDLLYLAREGEEIGAVEAVDLGEAVEAAWRVVAGEDADAELIVEDDLGTVAADYDRLRQLLENVLGNAIDHGGAGVTVRVEATDAGFAVEDDGPGIPEGERERAFEVGYSTSESGTGFGLHIVEAIADAHGWEVRAAEGEAGGARFEFEGARDRP